jgi:formate dehydrogenase iron-sulfur subunit
MQPACTKTCPTGALSFTSRSKLAGIKASAVDRGLTVYDGDALNTNVVFLLEDSPSMYGLPAKPAIPTPTFLWRTVMKPVGALAILTTLVALLAHYVTIGPKATDDEGGDSDVSSSY